MPKPVADHEIVVVGGGPAGLAASALLVNRGIVPALVPGPRRKQEDPRTTALMQGSLGLLEELGLWPHPLAAVSAPLWRLRLVDETGRLIRAPDITFHARELGDEPFGWNVPNAALTQALEQQLAGRGLPAYEDVAVQRLETRPEHVLLHLSSGQRLRARAVIAADGAESTCRAFAGIKTFGTTYRQHAIATSFSHQLPHDDCSTEHHRKGGPLTTVPLPGNHRSSLVWMDTPQETARLMALDEEAFATTLETELAGGLGAVEGIGPRRTFPARALIAQRFAANRIFLVGEAAHILPPIGAQGLNLGVRDAHAAAEILSGAVTIGDDPGAPEHMASYDRARRRDVIPRSIGVDLMNRSLLSGILPAQVGRAAALAMLDRIGSLRRAVMREGIGTLSRFEGRFRD